MNFKLVLILFIFIFSCKKDSTASLILEKEKYHFGDTIRLKNVESLDNVQFNNEPKEYFVVDSTKVKRGIFNLEVSAISHEKKLNKTFAIQVLSNQPEKEIAFDFIQSYPHNPDLFTQGFLYQSGLVFESSGHYNQSKIVSYALGETSFKHKVLLEPIYFAEGLTHFNQNFYVLTWKEKMIFKLDKKNLEIIDKIQLPTEINEGWGVTNNQQHLFISNGSSSIYVLNTDFEVVSKFNVVGYDNIYSKINELEYHNNYLYANIWQDSKIIKINPSNGEVVGYIDLSQFSEENNAKTENVLNGIAFKNNHLLFTGKNWNKVYEIEFIK